MIEYLNHNLIILNAEYSYYGSIYKCNNCGVELYGSIKQNIIWKIKSISELSARKFVINNIPFENGKFVLKCEEYIIKNLLE